jgi:hypothetical protein
VIAYDESSSVALAADVGRFRLLFALEAVKPTLAGKQASHWARRLALQRNRLRLGCDWCSNLPRSAASRLATVRYFRPCLN